MGRPDRTPGEHLEGEFLDLRNVGFCVIHVSLVSVIFSFVTSKLSAEAGAGRAATNNLAALRLSAKMRKCVSRCFTCIIFFSFFFLFVVSATVIIQFVAEAAKEEAAGDERVL